MQNPFTVSDPWGRFIVELWSIGEQPSQFKGAFSQVGQEGYDEELVMWFYNQLEQNFTDYCETMQVDEKDILTPYWNSL